MQVHFVLPEDTFALAENIFTMPEAPRRSDIVELSYPMAERFRVASVVWSPTAMKTAVLVYLENVR